jgi:hypothetical protein
MYLANGERAYCGIACAGPDLCEGELTADEERAYWDQREAYRAQLVAQEEKERQVARKTLIAYAVIWGLPIAAIFVAGLL